MDVALAKERDDRVVRWIRHPASHRRPPRTSGQRPEYVHAVAGLIRVGLLDPRADEDAIRKYLGWVRRWDRANRAGLYRVITEMTSGFATAYDWYPWRESSNAKSRKSRPPRSPEEWVHGDW